MMLRNLDPKNASPGMAQQENLLLAVSAPQPFDQRLGIGLHLVNGHGAINLAARFSEGLTGAALIPLHYREEVLPRLLKGPAVGHHG